MAKEKTQKEEKLQENQDDQELVSNSQVMEI